MSFEHIILVYIIPVLIWMAVISVTLRLLVKKQAVSATLSWLMIIYLVPLIGVIAYLIFGEIKLGTRRAKVFQSLKPKYTQWLQQLSEQKDLVTHSQDPRYRALFKLVHHRLGIPNIRGNELHILDTPESIIQSIIRDIQQARHSINMVFYIWSNDGLIDEVRQALEEAVQRGVKVCLLLDSVGSNAFLKSSICKEMRERGIEITEALHVNLFRMFFNRIDLRQHRKIIVIDNQIAYTGSMNMVDPNFFKQDSNVGNWIDVMVRINGPVSPILNSLHAWDWEIETTEEWVAQRQAMGDDLDAFIALTKKYVDVTELTQTIVNEYIRKIVIHAPDKSGGKRRQKVEIIFNFVDDVEIPVLAEPMIAESTLGRKKRRDLNGHAVLCPNRRTYSSLRRLSLTLRCFLVCN